MSTVYLHVGPHKTGTTYLQKLWESHPEQLKQHNLVYPKVFYMAKGQHHIVTHLLSNDKGEAFQRGMFRLSSINDNNKKIQFIRNLISKNTLNQFVTQIERKYAWWIK